MDELSTLIEEVRQLRAEVAELRTAMQSVRTHISRSLREGERLCASDDEVSVLTPLAPIDRPIGPV